MLERTDPDGRWESVDEGRSWRLVEPSQAWLDARAVDAANVPPDPIAGLLAELPAATLEETNAILADVLNLIGGN